jgi:regulator of protease activity HflC (stomatin/prohibitin superfamily)
MNRLSITVISLVAVLLVGAVVVSSSAYTIDQAEQAIVVQLGAPVGGPITEPGLHLAIPTKFQLAANSSSPSTPRPAGASLIHSPS